MADTEAKPQRGKFLLEHYFRLGWLGKKYYGTAGYFQPYSAEDRLLAGKMLYEDFLAWGAGQVRISNCQRPKIDGGRRLDFPATTFGAERFRRALRRVPPPFLPVLYHIVLEEHPIRPPRGLSVREKLYFNDEIKSLLCRGLDALVTYYRLKG